MHMAEEWLKTWICLSCLFAWARAARPRFDVSTDMGMVLVPADAEVDTAIFRLRATDQDADFPLTFEIIATTSPIVRVENLPCTPYNKVCQANVILARRLVPGRLHDFVVRVRDSKGDANSMQATISVTNATTPRDKIFPHLPSLIMVPEDTKPGKELDYLLVESNPYSGKPVYIELWQPKELFKIRQRQMGSQTKGIITLIGELDFETQSMYTLTMYATDPYTEPRKDTRNIAGLHVVVIVQDVQDVPPVFTLAPPLTKLNNSVKPGDVILRVHAEDGDKGVPREVTYGLIAEGNPFAAFFNVSETTGEIILARPLEEITQITHVGAPIILKIVAEEIRTSRDEPPAQATVVELGLLLGEPGNSPPYFENDKSVPNFLNKKSIVYGGDYKQGQSDCHYHRTVRPIKIFIGLFENSRLNYVAWMDENAEPGTIVIFSDAYSTLVKDEDIGKAGVFALKLQNNNGTFEISPAVAERTANFIINVRDNMLIDYERFKSLRFRIIAQEVGPATNLSASVPVTIFLRDVNDNFPVFDESVYEVTLSENAKAGTRVTQVHATDKDSGTFGRIQYVRIIGDGSEAFEMNPDNGLITVSMGSVLDREQTSKLELTVEARDEDGKGLRGIATLIVNILDVNDNEPVFEKNNYQFFLNSELTNFTMPAFIKAVDLDAEPPNNVVKYEIIHGNYENKFQLNEDTGELVLREAINKARKVRQILKGNLTSNFRKQFRRSYTGIIKNKRNDSDTSEIGFWNFQNLNNITEIELDLTSPKRRRRANDNPLFLLTVRAYDLGVPHLSNIASIRIMRHASTFARIVMFVMPGENPDPTKTAETLATITGGRVVIQEIKPYVPQINAESNFDAGKRSVVVARVEQNGPGTLVDVDKIRASLTANGFGIISGMDIDGMSIEDNASNSHSARSNSNKNVTIIDTNHEEVTVYKAENKLLTWLLVLFGLLLLAAVITLIICCICPSCPFYMEPRKRRIHSAETLIAHSDGRPKRHMHRKPISVIDAPGYYAERREAWSADHDRQHWQFNRRNTRNLGIASLPGDVVPGHRNPEIHRLRRASSLLTAEPCTGVFGEHRANQRTRGISRALPKDERILVEDVEALNRNYERAELESLRRHEAERGSEGQAPAPAARRDRTREQHFYRDGNAEVLRLMTRGDAEERKVLAERAKELYQTTGKDILLQRFIEDQNLRRSQDLRDSFQESLQEKGIDRSVEFHQRANETAEILILPERLELQRQPSYGQKQHLQEQLAHKVDVPLLIVERNYKLQDDESDEYRSRVVQKVSMRDAEVRIEGPSRNADSISERDRNAPYAMNDVELMRQNVLLTKLLLEKDARGLNVPIVDSSSFLETQSLPGHVAIATQTDRTAATQTEFCFRSRSDNEESEEDPRMRRKHKLKEKIKTKEDFEQMKTIWVRTPIPEESRVQSAQKKVTPTRRKIEVLESRKILVSPDVLQDNFDPIHSSSGDMKDDNSKFLEPDNIIKTDKTQKTRKLTGKSICTSQTTKTKEIIKIDSDSTSPSPETKEICDLMKGTIRKKIEKPPRKKKVEKNVEKEKSHFMQPSFRVLEKEINSFQQKIRDFGNKKMTMLQKEDCKNENKESENNDDDIYNLSKTCEITVNKSKKTLSRESSPTKITVEQRTKISEEESGEKTSSKLQQHDNSTLDLEDSNKMKGNLSYITKKCEMSKVQTRSHSKLQKQPHIDNSNSQSSSEKNEKSEDSENKTEKSSSAEMKTDSISSSSKDLEIQQKKADIEINKRVQAQNKKSVHNQRLPAKIRSSGIGGSIKRKLSSLKSKTIDKSGKRAMKKEEKKDKNRSLSSDESKENECHKESTPSEREMPCRAKSSTSRESMKAELDKFVKDVRGVVEKEISSLTQAAKDALNFKKSEKPNSDIKEQNIRSPLKLQNVQKDRRENNNKNQSVDNSIGETENKLKSVVKKEGKEKIKSMKDKPKLKEKASSSKDKPDEAISFIVIENSKMNLEDCENKESEKKSSKSEKSQQHTSKNNEKSRLEDSSKASGSGSKILDTKSTVASKKTGETYQIVSQNYDNTVKSTSQKVDEIKETAPDETIRSEKDIFNESTGNSSTKIGEVKKQVQDKINEAKKTIPDNNEGANENVSDNIVITKNNIVNEIDENKKTGEKIADEIKQSNQYVKDIIVDNKIEINNKIKETDKNFSNESSEIKTDKIDKMKENEKNKFIEIVNPENVADKKNDKNKTEIDEKLNELKKDMLNEIDKAKPTLFEKTDETEKEKVGKIKEKDVTDEIVNGENIVSIKIDETHSEMSDKIKKNGKGTSDKMKKKDKHLYSETVPTKNIISEQIFETKTESANAVKVAKENISNVDLKSEHILSQKIDKTDTEMSDRTKEANEHKLHTTRQSKNIITEKIEETHAEISDKPKDIIEGVSSKIHNVKSEISDKVTEKMKDTLEEFNKVKVNISDKIDEKKEHVSDKIKKLDKNTSDKLIEIKNIVSKSIGEVKTEMPNQKDQIEKDISYAIDETENITTEKIDETKSEMSSKIKEIIKDVSDESEEIETETSYKAQKAKKSASNEIDKTKTKASTNVAEKKENTSDGIKKTDTSISDKIIETKHHVSEIINETKDIISQNINETQTEISNKTKESEISDKVTETIRDTLEETNKPQSNISDKMEENKENISDKIQKADKNNQKKTNAITERKNLVSEKVNEIKTETHNKVEHSEQNIPHTIEESKNIKIERIHEKTIEMPDKMKGVVKDLAHKIDETTVEITEKIEEIMMTASDKTDDIKIIASEIIKGDTNEKIPDDESIKNKSLEIDKTKIVGSVKDNQTLNDVYNKVDKSTKCKTEKIHEKKEKINNEVDKIITIESNQAHKPEKIISNELENFLNIEDSEVNDTVTATSTELVKDKNLISDAIHNTKEKLSDKIEASVKFVKDKVDEFKNDTAYEFEQTKKTASEKINNAVENFKDGIDEIKKDINSTSEQNKKFESDTTNKSDVKMDKHTKHSSSIKMDALSTKDPFKASVGDNDATDINKKITANNVDSKLESESNLKKQTEPVEKSSLIKLKSISLPNKIQIQDNLAKNETLATFNKDVKVTPNKVDENKAIKKQLSVDNVGLRETTKDALAKERTYASTSTSAMNRVNSVTTVSNLTNENETTTKQSRAKQAKDLQINEKLPNKEHPTSRNANEAREASSTKASHSKQSGETESRLRKHQQQQQKQHQSADTKELASSSRSQARANASKFPSPSEASKAKPEVFSDNLAKPAQSHRETPPNRPIAIGLPTTASAADEDESEDDSSGTSDVSSKTALRRQPYGTPRHSASAAAAAASSSPAPAREASSAGVGVADGKPRQRWNSGRERDPLFEAEGPGNGSGETFPRKIEADTPKDKPKSSPSKAALDRPWGAPKSPRKRSQANSEPLESTGKSEAKAPEVPNCRQLGEPPSSRPVVIAVKRKERPSSDHRLLLPRESRGTSSPRRVTADDGKSPTRAAERQPLLEIRSKHLRLQVDQRRHRRPGNESSPTEGPSVAATEPRLQQPLARKSEAPPAAAVQRIIDYGKDPGLASARSRYMAWYQQKRAEMERRRRERRENEAELLRPRWARRAGQRPSKARSAEDEGRGGGEKAPLRRDRASSSSDLPAASSICRVDARLHRLRVRPLVNVESEQLKAIVRQGRRLRRAEGARGEDPPVQIFAPEKPPAGEDDELSAALQIEPRHHLAQHSEYKFEKQVPFFLHPTPPAPHTSPEHYQDNSADNHRIDDDLDSGIAVSMQGCGTRLRHQQLLDKKSVFDIAYSEAAPTQLRSDSSTPPT